MGIYEGLWRFRDKHQHQIKIHRKTHGADQMIMAIDRAIRCECVADKSVYD